LRYMNLASASGLKNVCAALGHGGTLSCVDRLEPFEHDGRSIERTNSMDHHSATHPFCLPARCSRCPPIPLGNNSSAPALAPSWTMAGAASECLDGPPQPRPRIAQVSPFQPGRPDNSGARPHCSELLIVCYSSPKAKAW
jgi:hypothetical protein